MTEKEKTSEGATNPPDTASQIKAEEKSEKSHPDDKQPQRKPPAKPHQQK